MFAEIEAQGGVVPAIEIGLVPAARLPRSASGSQDEGRERPQRWLSGLNMFTGERGRARNPPASARRRSGLKKEADGATRETARDAKAVDQRLEGLRAAAARRSECHPGDAGLRARAYCTLYEDPSRAGNGVRDVSRAGVFLAESESWSLESGVPEPVTPDSRL